MSDLEKENAQLRALLAQAQADAQLLREVMLAQSPQHVVDILAAHHFTSHVGIASLWMFGPGEVRHTQFPFHYLDLVGLYLQGQAAPGGVGTRLDVYADDPLLGYLDRQAVLTDGDVRQDVLPRSPLLKTLLKTRAVTAWVIVPLQAKGRAVGLLFLGLDAPVPEAEIETYVQVSEIISLCTAMHILEHEQVASRHERDALLDAVNDGVMVVGGQSVLTVNRAFRRLFNCQDAVMGMHLGELLDLIQVPPSVRQQLGAAWHHLVTDHGETRQGEFEMVTHEGSPVEIHWYSAPMVTPSQNHTFARLFVFHNVTPERTAIQVRSAFLSRVSHELRTPLTSISGFAQSILESSAHDLPDMAREYLEIIHDSAGELKQVFTELIEITRAQAGEIVLDLQPVDIHATIQAVVREHLPQAEQRQQVIHVAAADDLPPVRADADRMARVFASLIGNAIQYAPPGGRISVGLHIASVPAALPADAPIDTMTPAVVISVIDSGEGVQAADAEQVFEPFYRAKSAWVNQIEGTGLGLAVSRSLVQLHRGAIWVQPSTAHRRGGRFFVTLPIVS